MKPTSLLAFTLFAALTIAAQPRYYPFVYKGKYGITDSNAMEIVTPQYDKQFNGFGNETLTLINTNGAALLLSAGTGIIKKLDYLDSKPVDINFSYYYFAREKNKAYLMKRDDANKKIMLPKYYHHIKAAGDYIFAWQSENSLAADALNIKTNKWKGPYTILEIEAYDIIENRQTKGYYYVITNADYAGLLDKELNVIDKTNQKFNMTGDARDYFQDKQHVILTKTEPPTSCYPLVPSRYGLTVDTTNAGEIMVSAADESGKNPIFTMPKINGLEPLVYNTEINNLFVLAMNRKNYYNFYVDIKKRKIFFPKKYCIELNIKQ